MRDFGVELRERTDSLLPYGVYIDPTIYEIATMGLGDIEKDYGPDSANPLAYHNADHGLDRVEKSLMLTKLLLEYMHPEHQENAYELDILDASLHDRFQIFNQIFNELGLNEALSAAYVLYAIRNYGSQRLKNDRFMTRSAGGIISTTTVAEPNGNLLQPYLLDGEPDPHKAVLSMADVYAPIAMGGPKEMLEVCRTLAEEWYGNPTPLQVHGVVVGESAFIRKGLNPVRIKFIISHFLEKPEEVYEMLHEMFNPNIVASNALALEASRREDIAVPIGEAVRAKEHYAVGEMLGMSIEPVGGC